MAKKKAEDIATWLGARMTSNDRVVMEMLRYAAGHLADRSSDDPRRKAMAEEARVKALELAGEVSRRLSGKPVLADKDSVDRFVRMFAAYAADSVQHMWNSLTDYGGYHRQLELDYDKLIEVLYKHFRARCEFPGDKKEEEEDDAQA